jgi:hypothetical protein
MIDLQRAIHSHSLWTIPELCGLPISKSVFKFERELKLATPSRRSGKAISA